MLKYYVYEHVAQIILQEDTDMKHGSEYPEVGKWFEVDPTVINRNFFAERRKNDSEEKTRILIWESLSEVKFKNIKPFQIMIPKKTWRIKTGADLVSKAEELGRLGTWVEQALEWAQRLQNGCSWAELCSTDICQYNRLLVGKEGHWQIVGGEKPTELSFFYYHKWDSFGNTVPLVIRQ